MGKQNTSSLERSDSMEAVNARVSKLQSDLAQEGAVRAAGRPPAQVVGGRRVAKGHVPPPRATEDPILAGFNESDLAARAEGGHAVPVPATAPDLLTPEMMRRRIESEQRRWEATKPSQHQKHHHHHQTQRFQPRGHGRFGY